MDEANRPPSPRELAQMQDLVDKGMRDGAWGMATGLIYAPGSYSNTDELVALAEIVGPHNGIYASHIRNEGSRLLDSLDEILAIGQRAKLPVHVSHIKVSGKSNWGLAPDAIEKLRTARAGGQVVTADQYPYPASSTSLAAMVIPDTLRSGSNLKEALANPERARGFASRLNPTSAAATAARVSSSPTLLPSDPGRGRASPRLPRRPIARRSKSCSTS